MRSSISGTSRGDGRAEGAWATLGGTETVVVDLSLNVLNGQCVKRNGSSE